MPFLNRKTIKQPGPDELPAEIIKVSYDYISQYLVYIYNKLLENAEYPEIGDQVI